MLYSCRLAIKHHRFRIMSTLSEVRYWLSCIAIPLEHGVFACFQHDGLRRWSEWRSSCTVPDLEETAWKQTPSAPWPEAATDSWQYIRLS